MIKLLSLLILPVVLSLAIVNHVGATSSADTYYQTTDHLILKAEQCSDKDVSIDWAQYLPDSEKASFQTALGTGSWGVSYLNHWGMLSSGDTGVWVYWNETSQMTANFTQYPRTVYTPDATHGAYFVMYPGYQWRVDNGTACTIMKQGNSPFGTLSDDGQSVQNYLFTGNVTYPDGYAGTIVKATTGDERPVMSPDFTYTVADKAIAATDAKQEMPPLTPHTAGYTFKRYVVEWKTFKCNPWNPAPMNLCENSDIVDYKQLPLGSEYKAAVTDYGDYMLEAQYLRESCYNYGDGGATPDYCTIASPSEDVPTYNWQVRQVYLKIDGSTYSSSTSGQLCDKSGFCQQKDDGLGMFHSLDNINTFGLQKFFTAPIEFYATLSSKVDQCAPITVPIMNTSFQLTCLKQNYYNWSPTIMLLYTTILTATTGYLIAFNIFRTIKNINTPDHDGIEVAKL